MSEAPLTPYAGTSGWSGSDASRERAERDDSNGTTAKRQAIVLGNVSVCGPEGLTVKDLRDITGWHHGQASAALSVLHKEGRLARLVEKRDRCHIYVLPEQVNERDTQPYQRNPQQAQSEAEQRLAHVRRLIAEADKFGVKMVFVDTLRRAVD